MSNITPFFNQEFNFSVRAVEIDGEVYLVGRDVALALGYADTVNAIKQHCRGVAKHHPIPDSLGRMQETRILFEGDMYRLIVNSHLPTAEKFEAWVFDEVLPTIRKTGRYSAPMSPAELLVAQAQARADEQALRPARLGGRHGHARTAPEPQGSRHGAQQPRKRRGVALRGVGGC